MADVRNKTASIYIDDSAAQASLDNLKKKADGLNKSVDDLRKRQKDLNDEITRAKSAGENWSKQSKELSKLNTELGKSQKALEANNTQQKALQQQIDSKSGPSLKQQAALVTKLVNEYKNLGSNTQEAANKLKEIETASKSLNTLRDRLASVQQVQRQTVSESGGFGKIFEHVAEYVGAYVLIEKATEAVKDLIAGSVEEAMHAEEATARFKATLDNLGKTEVFERLKSKAEEMAARFKYLDSPDIVAVFEKLIDYGKLTEQQITELTPVIINFAAKQRIPIEEASDVITKSLEGNAKALKIYGINLKEASTPAERLKIIMTELKDKVDGAADAFSNTTAGKIAIAKQSYKDLQEEIGTGLLPALNKLLEWVNGAIKGLPLLAEGIKNTVSDAFTFFTEGPWAVELAKAERMAQRMEEIRKSVAEKHVQSFENKSNEEITAEVVRLQNQLSLRLAQKDPHNQFLDSDQLKQLNSDIDLTKQELAGLFKLMDSRSNKPLGNGDPNADPKAENEAAKKREELQKKILDENQKFLEALQKYNDEYSLVNQSEYMKELQQAFDKYDALLKMAKEEHENELKLAGDNQKEIQVANTRYKEKLLMAEEAFSHAKEEVNKKFAKKELDELKKQEEEKRKLREQQLQDQLKKGFEFLNTVANDVSKNADQKNQLRKAQQDYDISKAFGNKKYKLQQDQLNDEEALAIEAAKKRGDSVDAVEVQFQQKREELAKQHFQHEVELYLGYAQQILNAVTQFTDAKNSRETANLNKRLQQNDREKLAYQRMLNSKVISQQQYLAKINQLDADSDKKKEALEKKQFERNKKKQIAQAVINGLQAELKTLAEFGPPIPPNFEGIIAHAFTIGATIAEIAAITRQEYTGSSATPKLEKGGALNGPRHSEGGMPVINPRTGRKEAEVEGGEVILSRNTVRNNKPLVDALLFNSMYRDGARIDPWFKNRTFKSIDFSGITRSIQNVRHYASGGTFQANSSDTAPQSPVQVVMPEGFEALPDVLNALIVQLRTPQKNYVLLQDYLDAKATLDTIKADATFGKK